MLTFGACTAIQRLRKEQDAGDMLAAEPPELGMDESAAAMMEPREEHMQGAGRDLSWGAGFAGERSGVPGGPSSA